MQIIGGVYKHKKIMSPKGLLTRPTSSRLREALFNICQGYIKEASFLDLFAGSGAMGLEAMSRGAKSVTFIDSSKESIRVIQNNVRDFKLENTSTVIYGDVFQQIKRLLSLEKRYDIIYADPPYDLEKEGELESASAYVVKYIDEGNLLAPSGMLFIEESVASQPALKNLKNLVLKSTRRMGRSTLQQYQMDIKGQ